MCSSQTSIHDDAESISPHDLTTEAEPTKVLKQPELPTRQHTHQTILNAAKLTGDGLPAILTDLLQITWQLTSWMKVKGNLDFWYIIFTGLVSFWNMKKKKPCETSPAEILLCHECTSSTWNWCWVYTEVYESNCSSKRTCSRRKSEVLNHWLANK